MHSADCVDTIPSPGSTAPARLRRLGDRVARGLDWMLLCSDRSQQRRRLAELNDHMLRDLGLSRADVMAEATKPFWRS